MKNIAIAFALTTVATVSAVACGDSDSNPADGGKGGSSGASGASGDAGVSGAGAPMGGTAGAGPTGGASGAVTGGASGNAGGGAGGATGGTGGSDGGVGAEGGNGDGGVGAEGGMGPTTGCPTAEPAAMTMCSTRGLSCDLGDRVCRCNLGTGNWQCLDENGDCPAMPDPNGDCTGGQTACSYGEAGTCVCVQGNFTCDAGVVACPAMQPMDGAGCNMFPAGFDCTYPAGTCSCLAAGGGGMMRDWNCTTATDCPAMAPMNDSACTTPGLICPYTTPGPATPDPTCICNTMSQWECITP